MIWHSKTEHDLTRQKAKKLLLSQKQLSAENKLLKETQDKMNSELNDKNEKLKIYENESIKDKGTIGQIQNQLIDEQEMFWLFWLVPCQNRLFYTTYLKIELKFLNCCPEHLSEKNCGFESTNCSIIKWTVTINSWLFIDKSKGCRTSSSTRTSTPSFRTICRTVEFKTYWTWKIQVIRIWLTIIEKISI